MTTDIAIDIAIAALRLWGVASAIVVAGAAILLVIG